MQRSSSLMILRASVDAHAKRRPTARGQQSRVHHRPPERVDQTHVQAAETPLGPHVHGDPRPPIGQR